MPQCPHCQTPYEKGQRYCSSCGSFLLHPEEGDSFCPQCGVRVSPQQEFCHECDAPLQGEAAPPTKAAAPLKAAVPEKAAAPEKSASPPPEAPGPGAAKEAPPSRWLPGLLVGTVIIIIILLILLFTRGTQPPVLTSAPGAPAAEKAAPPSEQELKGQLQGTLSQLREAQLNKDIAKFMSVYSPTFPELDKKRADTLKAWQAYDFTALAFTIDKVQAVAPDNTVAWVTWNIETRNRTTQQTASVSQTFQVRFVKEDGQWRIFGLEEKTP